MEGKRALITGAARGIGRATAEALAAYGATVMLNDLDGAALEPVVSAIRSSGGQAHASPGDITHPDFPAQLAARAQAQLGGLDILVNNAGFTWDGTLHKMTDEQWQAILDVHLTAPFRLIRAAAPLLREAAKQEIAAGGTARARKIVNVSSTSGTRGNFGQANYAAAKAGVVGLTKTLAREWGPFNIQVNAVAFGVIDTRLTRPKDHGEKLRRGDTEIALGIPTAIRESAISQIPLGRPGTPQEAAGAILFLASPLSDYVSGQVLEVTGGM
ncbi:MAG: SDR family NAD(P)-dependent oxidoreductase [Terriglobia bacterium]